jgi:DNA replication regulator SLD3
MIPKREPAPLKDRSANLFSRSSSTTSIAEDQKAKKKALLEAELREAISALKRPNRALVGKEIIEETEQRRAATSLSRLKKSRKPVRDATAGRAAGAAVQVKATPANNRFKDVIAAESKAQQLLRKLEEEQNDIVKDEEADEEDDRIPASSSVVPSSAAPTRARTVVASARFEFSSPAVHGTPLAGGKLVQATPARATTAQAGVTDVIPPSSPILTRKALGRGTPYLSVLSGSTLVGFSSSPGGGAVLAGSGGIFETPLKARSAMDVGEICTPVRPLRLVPGSGAVVATPEMKMAKGDGEGEDERKKTSKSGDEDGTADGHRGVSIYQRLGWDKDYDLD